MKRNSSILPTKSLGGTGLILVVVQMSAMGRPMLGTKEVHSAATPWSCDGPADPWPLLPRTEALSLESSVEVPVMSLCILNNVYNGIPSHCSDLHTVLYVHKSKTSHLAKDRYWITVTTRPWSTGATHSGQSTNKEDESGLDHRLKYLINNCHYYILVHMFVVPRGRILKIFLPSSDFEQKCTNEQMLAS